MHSYTTIQGRSHWGAQGGGGLFLNQTRSKSFISNIRDITFTDVQKLYGPERLQFLPCMLQFLDNLWGRFNFSNYVGKKDHFTLNLLKRSDT